MTFHTTSAAMELEKLCREQSLQGRLFPVPRSLTADCGIAWRCDVRLQESVQMLIDRFGVEVSGVYRLEL